MRVCRLIDNENYNKMLPYSNTRVLEFSGAPLLYSAEIKFEQY